MTFVPATDVVEIHNGPLCPVCEGPSWLWRGSVHGYTCGACLDQYLAAAAARADAKAQRHRERLASNTFHYTNSSGRMSGK